MRARVVVIKISGRCLVDNEKLHVQHAYFSFSANHIVDLWSCRCRPRLRFLRSLLVGACYALNFLNMMPFVLSADYADMSRGQLLAKIHELEEVSSVLL